mgnify:CR=1 FL=1
MKKKNYYGAKAEKSFKQNDKSMNEWMMSEKKKSIHHEWQNNLNNQNNYDCKITSAKKGFGFEFWIMFFSA